MRSALAAQVVDQGRVQGAVRLLAHINGGRDRLDDPVALGDERQLDQPHAIAKIMNDLRAGFQGEASLAGAASPHQRQESRVFENALHLFQLLLAPNETGRLHRKVVGECLHAPGRRKRIGKPRGDHLIQVLRSVQIAQAVISQRLERNGSERAVFEEFHNDARKQNLAAMRGALNARDAVQGAAKVISIAILRGARMNAHAHGEFSDLLPIFRRKRALRVDGRFQGITRRLKGRANRVADRLKNDACVFLDSGANQVVMTRQGGAHLAGKFLPKPRAPDDIGKEKADSSRGCLAHMRQYGEGTHRVKAIGAPFDAQAPAPERWQATAGLRCGRDRRRQ